MQWKHTNLHARIASQENLNRSRCVSWNIVHSGCRVNGTRESSFKKYLKGFFGLSGEPLLIKFDHFLQTSATQVEAR